MHRHALAVAAVLFLAVSHVASAAPPPFAPPASSELVEALGSTVPVQLEPLPLPPPDAAALTTLEAVLAGRWSIAAAGGALLVLLALRVVGSHFLPALATDVGGAALAATAGAVVSVLAVLHSSQDPTAPVVFVAAASGFWAWASKLGLVGLVLRAMGKKPPVELVTNDASQG